MYCNNIKINKMEHIIYSNSQTPFDFEQILSLQQANLEKVLTEEAVKDQGFVTVKHDIELLQNMNHPYPHIVAKANNEIVGYALTMLQEMKNQIPVLVPMFAQINQSFYENKLLKDYRYFVMGQVCIGKAYRGKGIFDGLYKAMKKQMKTDFELIVTEVATRNVRSIKAHQRVGFQNVLSYVTTDGEAWEILVWAI